MAESSRPGTGRIDARTVAGRSALRMEDGMFEARNRPIYTPKKLTWPKLIEFKRAMQVADEAVAAALSTPILEESQAP